MAKIVIYNATEVDKQQISQGLASTDHYWEFCDQPVSPDNIHHDAEVVSVFISSKLTADVLRQMPNLKLIATRSTGFDHIDLDYTSAHGIAVTNVPTYGENTVAEYAFALLFSLSRHMTPAIDATKRGIYQARNFVGFDLKGKTIGIIGLGHIGRHSADIAYGLEMKTLAYDLHPDEQFAKERNVEYVAELDDLLARSDIITLHTPLLPSTKHMINDQTIAKMKDGVILLNTARGELVNNSALLRGLKSGKIGGAGLDTIEGERFLSGDHLATSLIKDNVGDEAYRHACEVRILQHMPNVIVTEHCAYDTYEAIARINATTVENMVQFWYGQTPNLVQPKS